MLITEGKVESHGLHRKTGSQMQKPSSRVWSRSWVHRQMAGRARGRAQPRGSGPHLQGARGRAPAFSLPGVRGLGLDGDTTSD